jgi:hypothetical protein
MPTRYPVPTDDAVRDVLSKVMGRLVTVAASEPSDPDAAEPGVLADYGVDDGPIAVCCFADVRLTNALGAVLTAEPATEVETAVAEGRIADATVENWNEIVNQLGRLLNSPDTPTLRLRGVVRTPGDVAPESAALLASPSVRRSFDVTVDQYGTGTLSLAIG